jgi:hypothetical protein
MKPKKNPKNKKPAKLKLPKKFEGHINALKAYSTETQEKLLSDILMTAYVIGIESTVSEEYKTFLKYIVDGDKEMVEFV